MARPGKAIFDVTMMAGWAFAAVLTGLFALTMADDSGDTAGTSRMTASLESGEARLVTGSIPDAMNSDKSNGLVSEQNSSYNPFGKVAGSSEAQIQQLVAELRNLKKEVDAFHTTTNRLRDENNQLKQRLVALELDRLGSQDLGARETIRTIDLPRREDSRSPFVSAPETGDGGAVDLSPTGSIPSSNSLSGSGWSLGAVKKTSSATMSIIEQPFTEDLSVATPDGRTSTVSSTVQSLRKAMASNQAIMRPVSNVVAVPIAAQGASQSAFGLDLGEFVSERDISAAWKQLSSFQANLIGDLKPLSRKITRADNREVLHLVVGPIQNAAQAATMCARLNALNYGCTLSSYRGQSLALN